MPETAIAISPILPLKTQARWDCELADEALYGMELELLQLDGDWAYVRTPFRYEGWAPLSGLLRDQACLERWRRQDKMVVLRSFADVMHEPKVQSYPYLTLPRGALVAVGEEQDGWRAVYLPTAARDMCAAAGSGA